MEDAAALLAAGRAAEARAAYHQVAEAHVDAREQAQVMEAAADCRAGQVDRALETLDRFGRDEALPPAVRRGALSYRALCAADNGRREAALESLEADYPGQRPSPMVLAQDQLPALLLLAEARRRQGQIPECIEVFAQAHELAPQERRPLLRAMALDAARVGGSAEGLTAQTDEDDDFTRAVAGGALLLEAMATGARLQVPPEQLQEVFARIAPALVRLDEGLLAEELSRRLAALGGPAPIRLGALLPLTGKDRRVGAMALGGLLLAQRSLVPSASPRTTLILQDTGSASAGAADGMRALVDQRVSAVIGPLDNAEAAAAAQVAAERQVPLVSLSLEPRLAAQSPWVFRLSLDGAAEVSALMREAAAAGVRRVGVLHPKGAPYSQALAEAAEAEAARLGMSVTHAEAYDPTLADFSNQARRLRRARVEAVFIPDVASRVSLIMPFLAAEQLWCSPPGQREAEGERRPILCLGNVTWAEPALLRDGGAYVQGALIAASYTPLATTGDNQAFVQAHRVQLGAEPALFAALAHDAARVVRAVALSGVSPTPATMRDGLGSVRGFGGLLGPLSADADGALRWSPALLTVTDGAFGLVPGRGGAP